MKHLSSLLAAGLLALSISAAHAQPCCVVTAIDASSATITAKENATGRAFQFRATSAASLGALRVGSPVYANFSSKQVSLDGKAACCAITSMSTAPAVASPRPVTPAAGPAPAAQALPQAPAARQAVAPADALPTATFGSSRSAGGARQTSPSHIVHLRGEQGIETTPGLPEGARKLLLMHVRTLPPGEVRHYIVNTQLAEEWIRTHPVPASMKPSSGSTSHHHSGCNKLSIHCAEEAGKHAVDEASRQAGKEWKHVTTELAHDWRMAEDCFADKTRHVGDIPINFSAPKEYTARFEKDEKDKSRSASGSVKGSVSIGVPIEGHFKARVDLFYIPCLPFAVRPKEIGAVGTMTTGTNLGVTANANGKFSKTFSVGEKFLVDAIPIIIAGIPVLELEAYVYLEGNVEVGGEGSGDFKFRLAAKQGTEYDFDCNGKGCRLNSHSLKEPPNTTTEDLTLKGKVHVRPAIYVALELDFDRALSARAGPQPYLWGEVHGCTQTSALQSTGAAGTVKEYHALTADLDWGLDLRAELLAVQLPDPKLKVMWTHAWALLKPERQFLWFKDLAPGGSNALGAGVTGATQVAVNKPAAYKLNMHPCYPYNEDVQYQLTWTGDAMPTAHPGCTWQAGRGTCWMNPVKGSDIHLLWNKTGANTLAVTPIRDKYGRVFKQQTTNLNIVTQ